MSFFNFSLTNGCSQLYLSGESMCYCCFDYCCLAVVLLVRDGLKKRKTSAMESEKAIFLYCSQMINLFLLSYTCVCRPSKSASTYIC